MTEEYLRVATPEGLETNLREHRQNYEKYVKAFSEISVADLSAKEMTKMTTQKGQLDTIAQSIEGFFKEEITKKGTSIGQDTVDLKNQTRGQTGKTPSTATDEKLGSIHGSGNKEAVHI